MDLSPDPYLDRAFSRESRGRHRIKPLLVRFCGRPLLCRHSIVDRAFHRQFSGATIFPLGGWSIPEKSWKYKQFGDFSLGSGPRPSQFPSIDPPRPLVFSFGGPVSRDLVGRRVDFGQFASETPPFVRMVYFLGFCSLAIYLPRGTPPDLEIHGAFLP